MPPPREIRIMKFVPRIPRTAVGVLILYVRFELLPETNLKLPVTVETTNFDALREFAITISSMFSFEFGPTVISVLSANSINA